MGTWAVIVAVIFYLVIQTQASAKCDLKAIFHTPNDVIRRNYDQFEIMERASFDSGDNKDKLNENVTPNLSPTTDSKFLFRFGDFNHAIKKNNNNVHTRITLAGPNHNNYYHGIPSLPYYYPHLVPYYTCPYNVIPQWRCPSEPIPRYVPRLVYVEAPHTTIPSYHDPQLPTLWPKELPQIPEYLIDENVQSEIEENVPGPDPVQQIVVDQLRTVDEPTSNLLIKNNCKTETKCDDIERIHVSYPEILKPFEISENVDDVTTIAEKDLCQDSVSNLNDTLAKMLEESLVLVKCLSCNQKPKQLVGYPIVTSPECKRRREDLFLDIPNWDLVNEPCFSCGKSIKKNLGIDIDDLNLFKGQVIDETPIFKSLVPNVFESLFPPENVDHMTPSIMSGYEISKSSGFYSDPTKSITYENPTMISVMPPQITHCPRQVMPEPIKSFQKILVNNIPRYVVRPIESPVPDKDDWQDRIIFPDDTSFKPKNVESCRCPYCAKYVKELNE